MARRSTGHGYSSVFPIDAMHSFSSELTQSNIPGTPNAKWNVPMGTNFSPS